MNSEKFNKILLRNGGCHSPAIAPIEKENTGLYYNKKKDAWCVSSNGNVIVEFGKDGTVFHNDIHLKNSIVFKVPTSKEDKINAKKPEVGELVYNTSCNSLQVYDGVRWTDLNKEKTYTPPPKPVEQKKCPIDVKDMPVPISDITEVGENIGTPCTSLNFIEDTSASDQSQVIMQDIASLREDIDSIAEKLNSLLMILSPKKEE